MFFFFLLYKEHGVELVIHHKKKIKLICVSLLFSPSVIFFQLVSELQDQGLFPIISHLEIERSRRERDQKMRQESSDRSQSTGAIGYDASNTRC